MLEDEKEGRLYKTVWLQKGKVSFSVSRINHYLSYYFIGFWVIVTLYVMWKFVGSPWRGCVPPASIHWIYVVVVIVLIGVCVAFLWRQKSDLDGTLPTADGFHDTIPWSKRIRGAGSQTFIRRYAPDEL